MRDPARSTPPIEVDIRMSGESVDITDLLDAMREAGFIIEWNGRTYPNRRDPGVRVYAKVSVPQ